MPEDPRPRHEYARPDTHSDFSVTPTDIAADEAVEPAPPEFPEEVDPSMTHLAGDVSVSETVSRPVEDESLESSDEVSAETAEEEPAEEPDFEAMTKAELLDHLAENGQNVSSRTTKDELVQLAKEG